MAHIERQIEVEVPVTVVYDQWTHFEEFPYFMAGVRHVEGNGADGGKVLRWIVDAGSHSLEWEAVLGDRQPCRLISWRNAQGAQTTSEVRFERLESNRTRVSLRAVYDQGRLAAFEDETLSCAADRIEGDLLRFKHFIEARHASDDGHPSEPTK